MGMFDELTCKYPLPTLPGNENLQDRVFQTKDTPAQFLDTYEIREDGTLWHQAYDIEDRSDPTKEGFARIVGMCSRVNQRWEQVNFTGEIRFYDWLTRTSETNHSGWLEFSAYFVNGEIKQLVTARYEP